MQALTDVILDLGLIGISLVVFIESGFPFGFFLPGDTLLFAAGLFAAQGQFSIVVAIAVIFLTNFTGVTVGYWSGKSLGKRWLKRENSLIFKHEYIEKATEFYERHGGKAIILGRFIPAVRSFVPIIAGVADMPYKKLVLYNAIGAIIWATSIPLIGFFSGAWLKRHGIDIETLVLPIILVIIMLSFVAPLVHALGNKKTRQKIFKRLQK